MIGEETFQNHSGMLWSKYFFTSTCNTILENLFRVFVKSGMSRTNVSRVGHTGPEVVKLSIAHFSYNAVK